MTKPDPSLLVDAVSPKVLDAMKRASEALSRAHVRHVVVGGLAVGAHGHPRATKDVDFLVGDEAFEHHEGGLVTLRAGVPFQVGEVAIDFLSPGPGEAFLEAALTGTPGTFIDAPRLVYLKLKSPRLKDRADVVELVKAGIDASACRTFLTAHAPALVDAFDDAAARAVSEDE